jgi:glc operon protein GlcG
MPAFAAPGGDNAGGPMSLQTTLKAASSVVLLAAAAAGQTTPAPPAAKPAMSNYAIPIGTSVSLDDAKKAAAAASAEAKKNGWFMAIAVVDPAGTLVYFEKADTTQLGSAQVAINKARSAALYKRPTKAFQDGLEKGGVNMRILALEGAVPVDGGSPLLVQGKLIGAIGVSGDLAEHDGQCATAGAGALTTTTVAR